MNVAIISPNQNAYSETFIQAHRNINAKVFYYYGGAIPKYLDGYGYIGPSFSKYHRIQRFIKKRLGMQKLSDQEEAFAKSLRGNRIDVVFAEFGTTGASIVTTCKKNNVPLITIFHGFDASNFAIIENFKKKYKNLFDYAKRIIAVSNPIKNTLVTLGCDPTKIVVTPCAPNDNFLTIEPTFKESKSFVAIGRFVNKKAPYYTILAIKKVAEKYPDVKLYFAGEGELLETCKNIVRYFKLENNVKLLGPIKPEEYISLLSKVTGFIQHSVTASDGDTEGTPVAVLEASAAGIPVIATRHAGIPDVIVDGETGLLVDEHDVDSMANKIIETIENPEKAHKIGAAGKQRVKEHFIMEKHLQTIENTCFVSSI